MDHERWMREAVLEAEKARGGTGDNPWVGCVIVAANGAVIGRGYTHGPGEDHAEIDALRAARASATPLAGATLYSTLEPCSFHGRTPACANVVASCGVQTLVYALRDPHPRVNGVGAAMVRSAGLEVVEGVLETVVRQQLAAWIFSHHSHEPEAFVRSLELSKEERLQRLQERYALPMEQLRAWMESLRISVE